MKAYYFKGEGEVPLTPLNYLLANPDILQELPAPEEELVCCEHSGRSILVQSAKYKGVGAPLEGYILRELNKILPEVEELLKNAAEMEKRYEIENSEKHLQILDSELGNFKSIIERIVSQLGYKGVTESLGMLYEILRASGIPEELLKTAAGYAIDLARLRELKDGKISFGFYDALTFLRRHNFLIAVAGAPYGIFHGVTLHDHNDEFPQTIFAYRPLGGMEEDDARHEEQIFQECSKRGMPLPHHETLSFPQSLVDITNKLTDVLIKLYDERGFSERSLKEISVDAEDLAVLRIGFGKKFLRRGAVAVGRIERDDVKVALVNAGKDVIRAFDKFLGEDVVVDVRNRGERSGGMMWYPRDHLVAWEEETGLKVGFIDLESWGLIELKNDIFSKYLVPWNLSQFLHPLIYAYALSTGLSIEEGAEHYLSEIGLSSKLTAKKGSVYRLIVTAATDFGKLLLFPDPTGLDIDPMVRSRFFSKDIPEVIGIPPEFFWKDMR